MDPIAAFVGLSVLLGNLGLPVGLPPEKLNPALAYVAPEECLFYMSWAGRATPNPHSANQTEQLLADAEVQRLTAVAGALVTQWASKSLAERETSAPLAKIPDLVATLLTRPVTLYVPKPRSPGRTPQDYQSGLLVHLGDRGAAVAKDLVELHKLLGPDAVSTVTIDGKQFHRIKLPRQDLQLTWGVHDGFLRAGVGNRVIEKMFAAAAAQKIPAWLTRAYRRLRVERIASVIRIDLKIAQEVIRSSARGPLPPAAGLLADDSLDSLTVVTGLDAQGLVIRTLLAARGSPAAMLGVMGEKPLTPADLAPIPIDANVAIAGRLDLVAAYDLANKIFAASPNAPAGGLDQIAATIKQQTTVDLKPDLLAPLGDTWCLYNSPEEGGLLLSGLTLVVTVRDHERLARTHDRLLALAKLGLAVGGRSDGQKLPALRQFRHQGRDIHFLDLAPVRGLVAPSWCLTEKNFIVALFPQNIKALLSRGPGYRSLASRPDVAAILTQEQPLGLTYYDARHWFSWLYPAWQFGAQFAASEAQRNGIAIDISLFPSAQAVHSRLRPAIATLRRASDGIEFTRRETIPGPGFADPTSLGLYMAIIFPAVSQVLETVNLNVSMNNLRNITIATMNQAVVHGRYPPATSADKSGKPLLSWRVHLLPYLGEQVLHKEFRLDEPWDSAHNKKLIARMPKFYRSPSNPRTEGKTNYLAVVGRGTIIQREESLRQEDVKDGTATTVLFVEVSDEHAVEWTRPDDFPADAKELLKPLAGRYPRRFPAAFADGHISVFGPTIDSAVFKALLSANGGEILDGGEGAAEVAPGGKRK